jgi:hypothetical protein
VSKLLAAAFVVAGVIAGVSSCVDIAGDCTVTLTCAPPPMTACEGTCVPLPWQYWQPPVLTWIGAGPAPMTCPASASGIYFQGSAPPMHVCPPCQCAQPQGSCDVPSTIIANATPCPGGGSGQTFDLPAAWDGSCTAPGPIPDAQSVTVPQLVVKENGCMPIPPDEQAQDFPTPAQVLACNAATPPPGTCPSNGDICAPSAPAHKSGAGWEWTYCISPQTEEPPPSECPPAYPRMYSFAATWTDTQTCTPCTCGQSVGSVCNSHVALYADAACSGVDVGAVDALSTMSMCVDVPPSDAILGVMAGAPAYTPGTCTHSGGAVTGAPTPDMPVTYCCL